MPAGGCPGDPDPIRVDPVFLRVKSHETHSAVHVLKDLGNRKFRLTPMHHRKQRITAIDQGIHLHHPRDHLLAGEPSSTHRHDDSKPIGARLWTHNIHRACQPILASVNYILLTSKSWLLGSRHHSQPHANKQRKPDTA